MHDLHPVACVVVIVYLASISDPLGGVVSGEELARSNTSFWTAGMVLY